MGRRAAAAREEMAMFSVVGVLGAGAGSALVLLGALVRRATERAKLIQGAARMPGGGAHEAS